MGVFCSTANLSVLQRSCTSRHFEHIQMFVLFSSNVDLTLKKWLITRVREKKNKNSVVLLSVFFCSPDASIISHTLSLPASYLRSLRLTFSLTLSTPLSLSLSRALFVSASAVHDRRWWARTLFWTREEYLFPKCHGDISARSLDLGCRLSAKDDNNMKLTFLLAAYQKPPDANRLLMPRGGRDTRGPWSVCSHFLAQNKQNAIVAQYVMECLCCLGTLRCSVRCDRPVCFWLRERNISLVLRIHLGRMWNCCCLFSTRHFIFDDLKLFMERVSRQNNINI